MEDLDEKYMLEALKLAKEAFDDGEVPVGAVVVCNNEIIGRGRNRREKNRNALAHAEIEAINNACGYLNGWRLPECTLYITMEPCAMCAGAIINSRIGKVVYAMKDYKAGVLGTVLNFNSYPLGFKTEVKHGLHEKEAYDLMQEFFVRLREKKKK